MYTREIAYLHWKIGFQTVFMHVYTRNCIFTLEISFQTLFMHVNMKFNFLKNKSEMISEMIVENDRSLGNF